MFIISKKNFQVRRADGSSFLIRKDFIGEIPEDVAKSSLVERAIRGGSIAVPAGAKDKELERAKEQADQAAKEHDLRPDAAGNEGGEKCSEKADSGEDSGEEKDSAEARKNQKSARSK